ncbi:MAG: hypothetical protein HY906_25650 [Deltaproteobacteria bacterium]|nr:hypothetical protein [Deltaproteobacteria bacterium]
MRQAVEEPAEGVGLQQAEPHPGRAGGEAEALGAADRPAALVHEELTRLRVPEGRGDEARVRDVGAQHGDRVVAGEPAEDGGAVGLRVGPGQLHAQIGALHGGAQGRVQGALGHRDGLGGARVARHEDGPLEERQAPDAHGRHGGAAGEAEAGEEECAHVGSRFPLYRPAAGDASSGAPAMPGAGACVAVNAS